MHLALGKRKGMIMDTPDKKQPRKHFFKIPANFYEISEEEQNAWTREIVKVLHGEVNERVGCAVVDPGDLNKSEIEPRGAES